MWHHAFPGHWPARGKRILASSLAGLLLVLTAVSAGPGWHELLHADADAPAHACLLSSLTHGEIAVADSAVCFVTEGDDGQTATGEPHRRDHARVDWRQAPSRAPPLDRLPPQLG
ncbi:MAG: hypothetical protein FJ387_22950 [Verrucomicrobia bacterium]|nr:hypothetical protein [Verrucomicrobiota bacterium]